jgi:hypothetical protein
MARPPRMDPPVTMAQRVSAGEGVGSIESGNAERKGDTGAGEGRSLGATPCPALAGHLHLAGLIDAAGGWLPFDRYMAAGAVHPRPGLLRARRPPVRHAAGVGQRLRHRTRAVAAVRPRAGGAGGAGAGRHRHARGVGIRRRLRRAGGAAAGRAGRPRAGLPRGGPVGRAAPAPAGRLQPWAGRVHWHDALPERLVGVVVGNEVLDAMPVQLLAFDGENWFERGVVRRGRRLRLGRPADRAAAAGRAQPVPARRGDRDPPAGRGLRAHAGRPAAAPARPSSSTTAFPSTSTTTRSATAAR